MCPGAWCRGQDARMRETQPSAEGAMLALLRSLKVQTGLYADRLRRGGLYQQPSDDTDLERHLHEAVDWLLRAQDAGSNRGVSYGADLGGEFLESYPETTGYI